MAVYGQGAPGVRIRLRDQSEVSLVTNPNITAGIVGYSSKGQFNKIIDLTSTAEQDTYLGSGFNNAKFNQGLYAARAVLNYGGFVEYVRPYGEVTIADDDYNQDLKTDTFTVAFDFSSAATTSFDVKHMASTRYTEDGLQGLGSRKINTITETLSNNTNVDFELSADAMTDAGSGTDKVMLFAIMNSDPTAAVRAGDRVAIIDITGSGTAATVTTGSIHGLSVGDSVIVAGTANYNGTYTIATVTDDTHFTFATTETTHETVGSIYSNSDTVNSGVDYLSVKTVASGKASKKYDRITLSTSTLMGVANATDTFTMETSTGADATFEFTLNGTPSVDTNYPITIVKDNFTTTYVATPLTAIVVTDPAKYAVGDKIHVTSTLGLPTGLVAATIYTVSAIVGTSVSLNLSSTGAAVSMTTSCTDGVAINLTATLRSIVSALSNVGLASSSQSNATATEIVATTGIITLNASQASKFTVDDLVILDDYYANTGLRTALPTGLTAGTVYKVGGVNLINNTITLKDYTTGALVAPTVTSTSGITYRLMNLTTGVVSATINSNSLSLDIIGKFGLTSPISIQEDATSFFTFTDLATAFLESTVSMDDADHKIAGTDGYIVIDSDIGRQFLNLGLATEDYQDINFDGVEDRVYQLTAEGEVVAKMYVFVKYYFGGELYEFAGTLVEYAYGNTNLYLKNSAEDYENGWTLVMNDNASIEDAVENPNFSLANSISDGIITSSVTKVAFDETDPAILNDAIWTYLPKNNNSSNILASAWNLFLNKDEASSDMLISAGTAISNLFVKNMEQINYTVMDTMLSICEKRKDLFAIFDGVDEPKITVALKKMIGIGSSGDLSRWGSLFDGRSIFSDTIYTKLNAQAVKSIEVAAIITANRASNVYWLPPAGFTTGKIPTGLAKRQKFIRTYNYADDINSDIARLYDANINPTRVNDQGQFVYGQKTMLKRMTALNRLNVIMLIAGIHKRFGNYLDTKVFQLNTAALRAGIQADLQAQLELIKSANPAGLTAGVVICDETNNTPDIIDTNQLIVDVVLQPTKTAEFITLRTTVQRTGADLKITNTIVGG